MNVARCCQPFGNEYMLEAALLDNGPDRVDTGNFWPFPGYCTPNVFVTRHDYSLLYATNTMSNGGK